MPEHWRKKANVHIACFPLVPSPQATFIISPVSIVQYWSRLAAQLPYWQRDNGVSGWRQQDDAAKIHSDSLHRFSCAVLDSPKSGASDSSAPLGPSENRHLVYLANVCLLTAQRIRPVTRCQFPSCLRNPQYGTYMRLLTCQNQTMANVSQVWITFTIGCHL